jgi:HEAT repeat protein
MPLWRIVLLAVLSVEVIGCARTEPTLAGGKPVEHWVQALKDPDARVRKQAAFKLGNAGAVDVAVLPGLVAALEDSDIGVRREATLALAKFGPEAKDAVPVLAELQQSDPDSRVRFYAGEALQKIQMDK